MKKIFGTLLASCAVLTLALALTSCSKSKKVASGGLTIEEGTLKIGMEVGYPPEPPQSGSTCSLAQKLPAALALRLNM